MTEIRLKMKQFYVHLSGCMFAGKTDTIRSILNKYALGRTNKLKCLHTKFDIDDRYTADDRVLTHSGGVIEKNEELTIDVMVIPCKPDSLLNLKTEGYDVICVDELHFMCDPSDALDERACDLLESFVARIVYDQKKILITAANDYWDSGKMIAPIHNLKKMADETLRLKGKCHGCGKFNATMSKFRGHLTKDAIIPGGAEHWMALCYPCFKVFSAKYEREYLEQTLPC